MTLTGLGPGASLLASGPAWTLALVAIPVGLFSAAVLYVTLRSATASRAFVPAATPRSANLCPPTLRPQGEIAARLAAIIGPAERALLARGWSIGPDAVSVAGRAPHWRPPRAAGSTSCRQLHCWARRASGALVRVARPGVPLGALVVSRVAWDVWIFLVSRPADRLLASAVA
jgi:hypothetical protein